MSKVAVVYWSGTGNTQMMAESVAAGAQAQGAEVSMFGPAEFTPDMAAEWAFRMSQKRSRFNLEIWYGYNGYNRGV